MRSEWRFHPVKLIFAFWMLAVLLHLGLLLSWPQNEVNLWLLGGKTARIVSGFVDSALIGTLIFGLKRPTEQIQNWTERGWWRWVKAGVGGVAAILFGIVFLPLSIKHYQLVAATKGIFLQIYALCLSGLVYSGLALLAVLVLEFRSVQKGKSKWGNLYFLFGLLQVMYLELLVSGWLRSIGLFE